MAAIGKLSRGYAYKRAIVVWFKVSGIRSWLCLGRCKKLTFGEAYSDHEDLNR